MNHKIFSFFSGAGFLDYGFESEGYDVVYVNEFHKPFLDAYKYARKELRIAKPEYGYYEGSITDFSQIELNNSLTGFINDSRIDGSLVGFIGGQL